MVLSSGIGSGIGSGTKASLMSASMDELPSTKTSVVSEPVTSSVNKKIKIPDMDKMVTIRTINNAT